MGRRLKVLLSAYACNPYCGSEEGVGWGWAKAIALHHDVWVLTAESERADIERWVERDHGKLDGLQFSYVSRHRWRALEKVWPPAYLWSYRLWLKHALRAAQELHRSVAFDVAHQLTYLGFRVPGHIWKLDIPFVWGPIGGLENTPWRLLPTLGARGCLYYASRNVINSMHKRFLTGPKRAFRKARGGIIAATEGIRTEIHRWYGEESEVVCEIALPPSLVTEPSTREPGEPLEIAWSGDHLPGKALPLLLRALAEIGSDVDWRLTILGQGSSTAKWRRLASRLGIDGRCTWTGWVERVTALERLSNSHLFVITSLKDLTSTVLLEALGQGLPVICPNHCGFANVVTADCGVKLEVDSPTQLTGDLARAIRMLAADEQARRRLAAGALRRSRDFDWDTKAHRVDAIYSRLVGPSRAPFKEDAPAAAGARRDGTVAR